MSDRIGHVLTFVSEEFLVEQGGIARRFLREAMRRSATDLAGAPVRLDRFQLDPFERHGDLHAPAAKRGTHVVQARFRVDAAANVATNYGVARGDPS